MISFVIGIFATYRLALLLYEEDGPFDLVDKFRQFIAENPGKFNPGPDGTMWRMLNKLLMCYRCVSLWVALPVAVILWWLDPLWIAPGCLALSGAAIWLKESNDSSPER